MEQRLFHITIGATPQPSLSLENDLQMVKTAVLYADRVKLCSAGYLMALPLQKVDKYSVEERLDFFERIAPNSQFDEHVRAHVLQSIKEFKRILQDKQFSIDKLFRRLEIKKELDEIWQEVKGKFRMREHRLVVDSFNRALKAGLLEIHSFKTLEDASILTRGFYTEGASTELYREFVEVVRTAMSNGSTYPLFDDITGQLVQTMVQGSAISASETRLAQARQSRLAADLLVRLPLFDQASIDEIIDIRKELENPLIRFRSAIITYAEKIKTALWDKDFSIEADQVFRQHVEPAVLDIEETVNSRDYLLTLIGRKMFDTASLATGAFSFLVSNLSSLSTITSLAMAVGVGAIPAILDATKDWHDQKQTVEQNQLYFYYVAKERLSELL